eukprot:7388679-Prymnesium_polylepis.1
MVQKLADVAVLTVRIAGARRLHVGADFSLHPGPTGHAPRAVKPYVTAHLAGRDGRRLEAEGFSFHSGLPKPELSTSESAPVWDDEFDFELTEMMVAAADSLVLTLYDSAGRGWFGASSWFGSSSDDVQLAQARVPFADLVRANLMSHEAELPLYATTGAQTAASISIRTWLIDLPAFRAEEATVHEGLRREARMAEGLAAERQRQVKRAKIEARIVEQELEADVRQDATVQAGR